MPIHVTSEIGPLRRVLLQCPGRELEHLSPETMEQLLFDDIPFLHRAQQEHDRFAELLRENGAEVVYLDALTAEVLAREPSLREPFVQDVIEKAGGSARGYREALTEYLLSVQDAEAMHRDFQVWCARKRAFSCRRFQISILRATRLPASAGA